MDLIIIDQVQFGYHTGNLNFCKYLRNNCSITYICKDHGFSKIEMDEVRVVYVSRAGNILVRSIRFLNQILSEIGSREKSIVFIKYVKGVSLALRLCKPSHYFVLDIRTGSVNKNRIKRWFYDSRLKFEAKFFKNVTIISQGLADKLNIAHKAHILPLGADIISYANKTFDQFRLIYVGTLVNRNIDVTIHGFKRFYDEFCSHITLNYTIIGTGTLNEENLLRELVDQFGLNNAVTIMGKIPHTQIKPFFDNANIGVSYIPMTHYYDIQPPLKTFEYLLSGMPVIATRTSENMKVINQKNGVLVGDSADEFYSGLKVLLENRFNYDSKIIRDESKDHTWEIIVKNNLQKYLNAICE